MNDIEIVVHFDLPTDHKAYLHRAGRTARAGNKGTSVVFVNWNEQVPAAVLKKRLGLTMPTVDVFSNDARLADVHQFALDVAADAPPLTATPVRTYQTTARRR